MRPLLASLSAIALGCVPLPVRRANAAEAACLRADGPACVASGASYLDGKGRSPNARAAAARFAEACALEDVRGCADLAILFAYGRGMRRDAGRAAELSGSACDVGDGLGCATLGVLALEGWGVREDAARATALFGKGCRLGSAEACLDLALARRRASRDPRPLDALPEYQRACDLGLGLGCFEAAQLLAGDEAAALYRRACDREWAAGCVKLGKPAPTTLPPTSPLVWDAPLPDEAPAVTANRSEVSVEESGQPCDAWPTAPGDGAARCYAALVAPLLRVQGWRAARCVRPGASVVPRPGPARPCGAAAVSLDVAADGALERAAVTAFPGTPEQRACVARELERAALPRTFGNAPLRLEWRFELCDWRR